MGVSSLTLRAAPQRIRVEGGFSSPLTNGRFVYTIDIQRILRGKNFWRIRTNYARIVCAIERSGLAWHAKGKRYCKGSSAVGGAEPYSTCTILVSKANGPSIGAAPTRASLAEQIANVCVRRLWIGKLKSGSWKRCGQIASRSPWRPWRNWSRRSKLKANSGNSA